jgi:cell shape-determining protein MreC
VRKQRQRWVLIIGIAALLSLIFLKPAYGWKLRAWLLLKAPQSVGGENLAAENEILKAELAKLQSVASELPKAPPNYLRAMVYSRYPFNFKNEFLVDAGSDLGIQVGKAVAFRGVLVGTIEKVFEHSSLARTVFDGSFRMPVRIGTKGYDALFLGGAYPKVTSIAKNAVLMPGDAVYAAAEGVPYGLPIALVAATSTSPDNLFAEAALDFAYDINEVQSVFIAK